MARDQAKITETLSALAKGDEVKVTWKKGSHVSIETGQVWDPDNSEFWGLGPDLLDPDDEELLAVKVLKRAAVTSPNQPAIGSVGVWSKGGNLQAGKRVKKGWYTAAGGGPFTWAYLVKNLGLPIQVYTPGTVPTAPVLTTLTPGNRRIDVAATVPANILDVQYNLVYQFQGDTAPEDIGWVSTGQTTGSFGIPSLENGVSFKVRLRAVNAAGAGPASNVLTATPYDVPSAPTNVTATPGNASATVTWTAPSSNGGSPITGYRIERISAANNDGWIVVTANTNLTTTSYTVTGLTNGTLYGFRVMAVNAAGDGVPSESSVGVTPTA